MQTATAGGARRVRAGTLGAAAVAVGLPPDRRVETLVNGITIAADPRLPLVAGDRLTLR